MDGETRIELHPLIAKYGFLAEVQREVLIILLNKSMCGDVHAVINIFEMLSKPAVEKMGMK